MKEENQLIKVLTPFNDYGNRIDGLELGIDEILKSGNLSQGEWVEVFEEKLGRYLGVSRDCVIATSSGTAALHIAVNLAYGKPDEKYGGRGVRVPSTTFIATSNAVKYCGHDPVFIDIDENTWNSPIVDGISVDLFGNPSTPATISDACESLGATWRGVKCGTTSPINCLSFFNNKIITTGGEGGALVLFDEELIIQARELRCQGKTRNSKSDRIVPAYNYRMTEIQALIGVYQLDFLDDRLKEKRRIHKTYVDILGDKVRFQEPTKYSNPSWFLNCIKTRENTFGKRDIIKVQLNEKGIETRDVFDFTQVSQPWRWKNSYDLYDKGLCIPSGPDLPDEDIKKICDIILAAI